ncbi:MAG TPA: TetR/AcrR family transcriptional regulator [Arenimonas sp.]|nr:TetR/AcrR family transcriptional regulator [Arenimonas sp.]
MRKPTLGRPKNLKKRQDILQAAAELFPVKGFASVSMMEIAEKAGVSKLTLYSHFADKDDLFAQSVIDCCEQQLPVSSFQLPVGLSLQQGLTSIGNGFLELIMDDKAISLHRMMIAQSSIDIEHSELFFKAGPERMLSEMQALLVKADKSGQLKIDQPKHAAQHFFCLLKGLSHMRVLMGLSKPPSKIAREKHVEEVVDIFMRAFRP